MTAQKEEVEKKYQPNLSPSSIYIGSITHLNNQAPLMLQQMQDIFVQVESLLQPLFRQLCSNQRLKDV